MKKYINKIKNKRILSIVAHPDDLEFYAAGTIKLLSGNNSIHLIVATSGENGGKISKEKLKMIRRGEQRKSAKSLGIKKVSFLNFRDTNVLNDQYLRKVLVKEIIEFMPEIIITFDPANELEVHPDHRNLGQAIIDSLIKSAVRGWSVDVVLLFDTLKPNVFIDVSKVWEFVLISNKAHRTQFSEFAGGWKEKQRILEEKATILGKAIGVKYAEAFRRIELSSKLYLDQARESLKGSNSLSAPRPI
ncbi:MAG: PIG-L family deacetylase [Candidatus Dojkabacteria bacterium]|nr:PIG-L family deacetylase [Candidatus Dojkabacteria bacterium]